MGGRWPSPNSTSRTGPMTCTTLPVGRPSVEVLACVDILFLECSSSIKAVRRENRYGFKPDRLAHAARRRQNAPAPAARSGGVREFYCALTPAHSEEACEAARGDKEADDDEEPAAELDADPGHFARAPHREQPQDEKEKPEQPDQKQHNARDVHKPLRAPVRPKLRTSEDFSPRRRRNESSCCAASVGRRP